MSTRISKPATPMRKVPRQARSRATVEAITYAGAQVLGARGWLGFTTNEVALIAGVSIGSLYQYFPDKHVLIDAIRDRHLAEVLAVMQGASSAGPSSTHLVEQLVDGLIAAHGVHPALHRVLLDEVPRVDSSRAAQDEFEARYLALYAALVSAHRGAGKGSAREMVVQVLSSAVEGVIHNAARRGTLKSPRLRRELVHLVRTYLGDGDEQ